MYFQLLALILAVHQTGNLLQESLNAHAMEAALGLQGIHFEGPAPRPLERFKITLADDGQIIVDKTQKYQQEKGQWNDPESF